ncbi:MAG TPA: substrate-binding domain-containing protein [Burkholderiales bacterium]|nr:substrate-binding domain-containing protein [Burkholderiales bacterium]
MRGWMKVALAGALVAHAAPAAEITVLSGGAIEPGLKAAAAAFEKQTGHTVKITFNTAPQMRARVAAGELFDVVIAPPKAVEEFAAAGKVGGERVNVGRVGVGAAVRPGAPLPDLSSVEALRKSVLEAESVVFNRASSGLYFEALLKKLGIYGEIEAKAVRYATGAEVMEHLLYRGKGREIGFGPITEILLYREKGLRLAGPLPLEVQNYTSYIAVPMAGGANRELAQDFVRFLGGPSGKPLFVAAGID